MSFTIKVLSFKKNVLIPYPQSNELHTHTHTSVSYYFWEYIKMCVLQGEKISVEEIKILMLLPKLLGTADLSS